MELKENSSSLFEYNVKVLVIGDPLIGKSDFIKFFIDYNSPYETLGNNNSLHVNYSSKILNDLHSRPNDRFRFHI